MDAACEKACACEIIFCDVELPDWTNNLPAACQYRTQALRIWKKVVPPFLSNRLCYTWCTMPRSLASIFRKSYKRNKFLPFSNFLLTYHYFLNPSLPRTSSSISPISVSTPSEHTLSASNSHPYRPLITPENSQFLPEPQATKEITTRTRIGMRDLLTAYSSPLSKHNVKNFLASESYFLPPKIPNKVSHITASRHHGIRLKLTKSLHER
jgi:hypothetical protein